jgi:Rod binding domain-containing protein
MDPVAGVRRMALPSAKTPVQRDDPKRVADAARQFESLMIGQLLKSMRESGEGGWLGTGDDQAGAQAMELAEEQMAQALAQQGGFGLARLVVTGLKKESNPPGDALPAAAAGPQGAAPGPAQKLQP